MPACSPARTARAISSERVSRRTRWVRGPRARRPAGVGDDLASEVTQRAASGARAGDSSIANRPSLQSADEQHQQREDQNRDAQGGGDPCKRFGDGSVAASALTGSPVAPAARQRAGEGRAASAATAMPIASHDVWFSPAPAPRRPGAPGSSASVGAPISTPLTSRPLLCPAAAGAGAGQRDSACAFVAGLVALAGARFLAWWTLALVAVGTGVLRAAPG